MERSLGSRLVDFAWVFGVFAAVCIIWEIAVKCFGVPAFILPSVEDVVKDFFDAPILFLENAAYTIGLSLLGFFIAAVCGLILAFAIISSRILDKILMTFLSLLHSVPKIALAPLFVLWLGTGYQPKIAIAALMSILIIVVEAVAGFRSVDPEMVNLARVHHASPLAILWKIRLPNALPHLFSAWKVAISLALVGTIVGEFVGGQMGLGYMILVAQGSFDTPRAFAAVFLLSVIATGLFYLVVGIETLCIPWHVSQRRRS
jgi:NitT/TauT family transport system permease protein